MKNRVNLLSPINRNERLNLGRVAWWLSLDGISGGSTWYDLIGQNHFHINTDKINWKPTARYGGFSQIGFYGTNGAQALKLSQFPAYTNISFALWISYFGSSGASCAIASHYGQSGVPSDWYFYLSNNVLTLDVPWVYGSVCVGGTINDTKWHRIGFSRWGATGAWNWSIYLDGVRVGHTTNDNHDPSFSNYPLRLATLDDINIYNSLMDDVSVWSRALSDNEWEADYLSSKQKYANVLNYSKNRYYSYNTLRKIIQRRNFDNRVGQRGII